jgi:hypothetical protein
VGREKLDFPMQGLNIGRHPFQILVACPRFQIASDAHCRIGTECGQGAFQTVSYAFGAGRFLVVTAWRRS